MILFINACVRENSRTKRLADHLLSVLDKPYTELRLSNHHFPVTDSEFLNRRDMLISHSAFDDEMFALARQFEQADEIVIAAPYWDLSFPAALKQYFEHINVLGVTFRYTPEGIPEGLCRAKKLYYVMTAGGNFCPDEFGYGYVKSLAQNFYGIADVRLIKATGLDIVGADEEQILQESMDKIDCMLNKKADLI